MAGKIDIHLHCIPQVDLPKPSGRHYPTPDQVRKIYDIYGIEKGVVMPCGASPECSSDRISMREARQLTIDYPDTLGWWFCAIDPRAGKNSPETDFSHYINYYKSIGARGVGELTAGLEIDDPRVFNLFHWCEKLHMPVTIHLGDVNEYGLIDKLHLPRYEYMLQSFPNLIVLGHSARFWSEMGTDVTEANRASFPPGKVQGEGRVAQLLRKYKNLHCDLSSISGYHAMTRDPEYSYEFMEEFSDRLMFGTDISEPEHGTSDMMKLSFFLDDAVQRGKISDETYKKISRENALKLLEGSVDE